MNYNCAHRKGDWGLVLEHHSSCVYRIHYISMHAITCRVALCAHKQPLSWTTNNSPHHRETNRSRDCVTNGSYSINFPPKGTAKPTLVTLLEKDLIQCWPSNHKSKLQVRPRCTQRKRSACLNPRVTAGLQDALVTRRRRKPRHPPLLQIAMFSC